MINPYNKKIHRKSISWTDSDFDVIIAGTEYITDKVMSNAKNLKYLIKSIGF